MDKEEKRVGSSKSSANVRCTQLRYTSSETTKKLKTHRCVSACLLQQYVQGGWGGCRRGNGKKLSNSQACCLAQLCQMLLNFFQFPVGHPPHPPCSAFRHRIAHRKWKENKLQPGTAGPGNMLGCSLVSFHFLWAILCPQAVHVVEDSWIVYLSSLFVDDYH